MANGPAKKFRIGYITANVWKNDNGNRTFYNVNLTRTYKNSDGGLEQTDGLGHGDLLNAVRVLQRAESWISDQE